MFNFFKKKKPIVVVATLNARLMPADRADIEDALDAAMAHHKHGVRVVGGGTMMASNGEVRECDIEIEVDNPTKDKIEILIGTLEAMLAPKGSRLVIPGEDQPVRFGAYEGLALYLNGTELPDDVYQNSDINHVMNECQRLLEGVGSVSSHWQGPTETALYMYGASFELMQQRLTSFLQSYPLCQKCRVEQIA